VVVAPPKWIDLTMNRQTGLILLVCILVLGGIAYYLNLNPDVANNPTPTSSVPSAPTQTQLWSIDPAQVQALTVFNATTQVTFKAQRDSSGNWMIAQPQSGVADPTLMSTIVNTAVSLTVSQTLDDVGNLADFGLTAPLYAMEVKLKDGQSFKATIGQKTVTGSAYYVLSNGSTTPVLVPSGSLDTLLNLPTTPPLALPTPEATVDLLPTLPLPGTTSP